MNLHWTHPDNGGRYSFLTVDLEHTHFDDMEGVYIIWHQGKNPAVVYVGQGEIANRLSQHRENKEILQYETEGTLRVTWAKVASQYKDGVERYLANEWSPLVGDSWPDVDPIAVNSPWENS